MIVKQVSSVMVLLVLVVTGHARQVQERSRGQHSVKSNTKSQPAIEFGHEGGSLRPYRIVIYTNGAVEIKDGAPSLKVDSITTEKVQEVVDKASNRTFWKNGETVTRPSLPDYGFVFVRVRTRSGKTIYHHGAQTGPLGELYSELFDLVMAKP